MANLIHSYNYPLDRGGVLKCEFWSQEYWLGGSESHQTFKWLFNHSPGWNWGKTIALGLSGTNRFGHLLVGGPYPVGWHSVLLARFLRSQGATPAAQLLALIHDAPECLGAGDMNGNLKRLIGDAGRRYEDDLLAHLCIELGVSVVDHEVIQVHAADKAFGRVESSLLGMNHEPPREWTEPEKAVETFLRGKELCGKPADIIKAEWAYEWHMVKEQSKLTY